MYCIRVTLMTQPETVREIGIECFAINFVFTVIALGQQ